MTTNETSQTVLLLSSKTAVETIRGLLGWACDNWTQTDSSTSETTLELRLVPGSLGLPALCWVLAHPPGCTDAALTAGLPGDFTGKPLRELQDFDVPPSDQMLMRCMNGVVAHLERQEALRGLLDLGAACIQTGLDLNAAVAEGDKESANYFRSSARVVRGCVAAVMPLHARTGN